MIKPLVRAEFCFLIVIVPYSRCESVGWGVSGVVCLGVERGTSDGYGVTRFVS